MIDANHDLPVTAQAQLLDISRSTVYYVGQRMPDADFELMKLIDRLHLEYPFAGARMMRDMLRLKGFKIGRRHAGTLMRLMGLEALYRKKSTSKKNPEHKVFPYLLRGLTIDQPNHVWCADITYIPMERGFVYLFTVLDWATRRVLAWRLSNTMTTDFCTAAVEDAILKYGCPEIFNTDQGSQFTDCDFVKLIRDENAIALSMDGKGCWRDNVFIERFWRSLKYEEVYLRAYGSLSEAKSSIARYIDFYNSHRPHSSLDGKTPDSVYFGASAAIAA
jgi:putative transposase